MKTLLMGLGRQGYRMLELALDRDMGPIDVVDVRGIVIRETVERFQDRVRSLPGNPLAMDEKERESFLAGYDLVLDALPSFHSYGLLLSAIRAGTMVVSVSFLEEDFMSLDAEARENGTLVIPDCGGAPGFSHLMAGYSVRQLGGADEVIMKVGAIPAKPSAPFFHSLTWSVEDLMEEYFRPAKCRQNGRIEAPDPFCDVKDEQIQGLALQSFLSDGARSFLGNYPDVPFMEERTLRHYGHLEFMQTIRDAGLLTREPLEVGRHQVVPYRVLAAALERTFSSLPPEDQFIIQVEVASTAGKHVHDYNMPYGAQSAVFGLVNSVAVTAIETAAMVLDGTIKRTGVCPLELLADEEVFRRMVQAHRNQGAVVTLTVE